ncbi:MAG: glycosyltransferase family 2 protein [Nitrospinae bacterium]|nr:glycosyltransferase family 2 protein [Nitrospinota bacterium]
MHKNNLVSVIILTWNRKDDTLETIGKIKRSDYKEVEIILVDNASEDGTDKVVRETHPDVQYIYLKENIGIGGYNHGLESASGEFVVFLDSDSYPDPWAIGRMVRVFQAQPGLGAVAFDVRNAGLEKVPNHQSQAPGEKPENRPLATGAGQPATGSQVFNPSGGTETGSYNGAGVGIRRDCLKKAGALFSPLFLYLNEFDHSFRIWNSGYRIKHFPDIFAYHKASPTGRTSSRAAYFYTRNMLWIIWRYFPASRMAPILFSFFYHAAIFSLSQGTTIYLKAILDAFVKLPMIFRNRVVVAGTVLDKIRLPVKWVFMSYG